MRSIFSIRHDPLDPLRRPVPRLDRAAFWAMLLQMDRRLANAVQAVTSDDLGLEATNADQLSGLVDRWRNLPYYRSRLAAVGLGMSRGRHGFKDASFQAAWERIPLLSKRDLRASFPFPQQALPAGQTLELLLDTQAVEVEQTSGTSGERVTVVMGRGWWNEQEERALRLNALVARVLDDAVSPRRVLITTPTCSGAVCHSKWLNRAQRTFGPVLSVNQARIPFLLKEAELERMAREIADWSPLFLDLDPVHGAWLALFCERRGIRFPSVRFVVASYEFVSVVHRRILERVFGVPVFSLYGSTETGHLLMEDAWGAMRSCDDNAFLEVVAPDDRGVGDLVVTTLTNEYMPLLRYRIGDVVERRVWSESVAYAVHGRARDTLRTHDRGRVTTLQVDACFAGVDGIAHYQLRQGAGGTFRLGYVPAGKGPSPEVLRGLISRLEGLLGACDTLEVEALRLLPPTPSGKFRLTYSGEVIEAADHPVFPIRSSSAGRSVPS